MDVTIANTPHHLGRMNFNFTSRIFQVLIILGSGFISYFSDCLTVSAVYGQDIAEFTCTISPYTLFQRWYIDSVPLADCGAVLCSENISNPKEYSFTTNVNTGIFVFKIDPIKSTDNKRIVECFDGTDIKSIEIALTDNGQNHTSGSNIVTSTLPVINISTTVIPVPGPCGALCIGLSCVGIVLLLIIILVMIIHYCVRPRFIKTELKDTNIYLEWTDRLKCCNFDQRIFGYNIVCVRNPTQGAVKNASTNKTHCTLENLNSLAIYEISLSRTLGCCKSLATKRSVITRKKGISNDQECHANSTSIDVRWTKPDCINSQLKYKVTCNEEVKKDKYDQTNITLKDLIPDEMYKIEVFAIDKGTDRLLLAQEISTTSIQHGGNHHLPNNAVDAV